MRKARFAVGSILFLLILHSSLCFAYEKEIGQLSSTITDSISKSGKKTIAVVDFTDLQGNITELGRFISEELSVDLSIAAKGFEVIDRNHLKSILEEHKLSISGLVNPNNLKKLGQIAGVDAIVTGSVTPFGDSIRVTAKVITTDTARVIGAAKGDIAKIKAIEELLGRGIETSSGPVSRVNTSIASRPPQKALQSLEADNYIFDLKGCSFLGRTVTCHFIMTNKSEDRNFILLGNSRIFDEAGNEYKVKNIQLGNKSDANSVTFYLVSGVPTKASLTFEGVSAQIERIELLEIVGYRPGPDLSVKFRNIPLSK